MWVFFPWRLNNYYILTFSKLCHENGKTLIEIGMHCYMGFQGELIEFYGGGHFSGGVHYLNKNGERIIPTE